MVDPIALKSPVEEIAEQLLTLARAGQIAQIAFVLVDGAGNISHQWHGQPVMLNLGLDILKAKVIDAAQRPTSPILRARM